MAVSLLANEVVGVWRYVERAGAGGGLLEVWVGEIEVLMAGVRSAKGRKGGEAQGNGEGAWHRWGPKPCDA